MCVCVCVCVCVRGVGSKYGLVWQILRQSSQHSVQLLGKLHARGSGGISPRKLML